MTKPKRPHNPYLSLIGAIAALFLVLGAIGAIMNIAEGDGPMSPALWIGLIFGTLWLAISAIVYPFADVPPTARSQTSPARHNFGITRPSRPTDEARRDGPDPIK